MNGISVIIPAYNEEKYLPETLKALNVARSRFSLPSEVIVVDNVSTDRTAEVATSLGARVVRHDVRNISSVRNAGIREARYDLVMSIDADCGTPPDAFTQIHEFMSRGGFIGGGLGLRLISDKAITKFWVSIIQFFVVRIAGIEGAVFFFLRDEALAIGGFDESRLVAEDSVFARAMHQRAVSQGKKFGLLRSVKISTIDRKETSVWTVITHVPRLLRAFMGGKVTHEELDYWYNPKR